MKKLTLIALYLVLANISTLHATEISASSAIVVDIQTGFILYEKNMHEQHYPASITKVMTALIALEQYGTRLDEQVYFSNEAVYGIPWNSSHIAMNAGESLTMEDALYGLMLASANEVAGAIAEHIGGDMAGFATHMNRRAAALGAENTHFTNSSGLHDPAQITTAYDMALIFREAIRHPKFVELISTVRHDIPPTEFQPLYRELLNSNRMLRPGQHYSPSVVGGKTGFTNEARHTLVTYAIRGDRELLVVTLHGEGARLYTDTRDLLNYAFAIPYEQTPLFSRSQHVHTVPVYDGWNRQSTQIGEVQLLVPENVYLEIPPSFDIAEAHYQFYAPSRLTAPIQAGQNIGRVVYGIRGITMGDIQLRAANTILPPAPPEAAEEPVAYEELPAAEPLPVSRLDELLENYLLTVALPLIIFILGLMLSVAMLRVHHTRRQARLGRFSVIGSHVSRSRR